MGVKCGTEFESKLLFSEGGRNFGSGLIVCIGAGTESAVLEFSKKGFPLVINLNTAKVTTAANTIKRMKREVRV